MSTTVNPGPGPSSITTTSLSSVPTTMGTDEYNNTTGLSSSQQHSQTYPPLENVQTFRLSPHVEEEIIAAVKGSTSTANFTSKKWATYQSVLRALALVICAAIVLGEIVLAFTSDPSLDTTLGLVVALLVGGWNAWRLFRLHRRGGREQILNHHLIIEGSLVLVSFACSVLILFVVNNTNRYDWGPDIQTRGNVLGSALLGLFLAHMILFTHFCVERLNGAGRRENAGFDLPMHSVPKHQPPPAQIIVQYVHKCSNCGSHSEPKPGEAKNEHLAARGDLQPQGISAAHFHHHQ